MSSYCGLQVKPAGLVDAFRHWISVPSCEGALMLNVLETHNNVSASPVWHSSASALLFQVRQEMNISHPPNAVRFIMTTSLPGR